MAKQQVLRSIYFTGYCTGKYHAVRDGAASVPLHFEVFDITITELDGYNTALASQEVFDAFEHDLHCTRIMNARCTWQGRTYHMRLQRIKVRSAFGVEGVTQDSRSSFARFEGEFCAEAIIDDEIEIPEPEPDPREVEPITAGGRNIPTGDSCMGGCAEGLISLLGLVFFILLLLALLSLLGIVPLLILLGLLALLFFGSTLLSLIPSLFLRVGRGLFSALLGLLSGLLLLSLLGGLFSFLFDTPSVVEQTRTEEDRGEIAPPPELEQAGDDTLIVHHLKWKDHHRSEHALDWKVRVRDARRSFNTLDSIGRLGRQGHDWSRLYRTLAVHDVRGTAMVHEAFDSLARQKQLGRQHLLEAMVTCVQDIPYVLIMDGACPQAGPPCKSGMSFGVNPPAGFVADLKGDCDTRSLLLYSLLDRAGFDVAILLSERYEHAMLGVAVPGQGAWLEHGGTRYYFWETTATGHRLGDLHPRMRDLRYWRVVKPDLRSETPPSP